MEKQRVTAKFSPEGIEALKKITKTLKCKTYDEAVILAQKQFADVPAEIVRQDVRKQNEELHKAINKLNNEWKKGNEQTRNMLGSHTNNLDALHTHAQNNQRLFFDIIDFLKELKDFNNGIIKIPEEVREEMKKLYYRIELYERLIEFLEKHGKDNENNTTILDIEYQRFLNALKKASTHESTN